MLLWAGGLITTNSNIFGREMSYRSSKHRLCEVVSESCFWQPVQFNSSVQFLFNVVLFSLNPWKIFVAAKTSTFLMCKLYPSLFAGSSYLLLRAWCAVWSEPNGKMCHKNELKGWSCTAGSGFCGGVLLQANPSHHTQGIDLMFRKNSKSNQYKSVNEFVVRRLIDN